jgi:hypothetical protein
MWHNALWLRYQELRFGGRLAAQRKSHIFFTTLHEGYHNIRIEYLSQSSGFLMAQRLGSARFQHCQFGRRLAPKIDIFFTVRHVTSRNARKSSRRLADEAPIPQCRQTHQEQKLDFGGQTSKFSLSITVLRAGCLMAAHVHLPATLCIHLPRLLEREKCI